MTPELPPGFVLESTAPPAPPPGFVIQQQQQPPGWLEDAVRSVPTGVRNLGAGIMGLPGDLASMTGGAPSQPMQPVPGTQPAQPRQGDPNKMAPTQGPFFGMSFPPTSAEIQRVLSEQHGPAYQPKTVPGQYTRTATEFGLGLAFPGGPARRIIGNTLAPAIGSETAGQLTAGTSAEPAWRVAGAVTGGMMPAAISRMFSPLLPTNAHQAAVNSLRNEGVTSLSPGVATGNRRMRYFEEMNAPTRSEAMMEAAKEQYTAAALQRIGETTATRATPDILAQNYTRIGQQFDDLAMRTSVPIDVRLWGRLQGVLRNYEENTPPSQRIPAVQNLINDIGQAGINNQGILQGAPYQAIASRIRELERGATGQDQRAWAGIRQALDEAVDRLPGNSGLRQEWAETRRQYRNFLVIERAATGAGSEAAAGLLSPQQLRTAVTGMNRRDLALGRGDFADLVRSGNIVFERLPNSGTAQRLRASGGAATVPAALGTGLGSGLGAVLSGGEPTITGLAGVGGMMGGMMLPGMLGAAAMSRPGQWFLAGPRPGFVNQGAATLNAATPPWMQNTGQSLLFARPYDRQ